VLDHTSSRPALPHGPISRRATLRLLTGAGAWAALGGCVGSTADSVADAPASGGATGDATGAGPAASGTPDPARSGSAGASPGTAAVGVALEPVVRDVHLSLRAAPGTAEIVPGLASAVLRFDAEVLDGDPASVGPAPGYLGPTLHLREGQRVRISFDNELDEPCIVHWHGLAVPQDQDGQPPEAVGPGERYEYDFVIDNDAGTYWYHPHPHGRTGEQVYRGLAGLLIVHPAESPAVAPTPPLPDGDRDLALVLADRTVARDGTLRYASTMHDRMAGFVGDTLVTNGVVDLTVAVSAAPHRLRILNGANARTSVLRWSDGRPFTVLATDGHLLTRSVRTDRVVLTPAQRVDLWVDFAGLAGSTVELLSANAFVESAGGMGAGMGAGSQMGTGGALELVDEVAATFAVGASPESGTETETSSATPASAPTKLGPEPDWSAADAVAPTPKQFVLSTRQMTHWINDAVWDERQVSQVETAVAGTVELWEFVNRSPMPHPMHLHGLPFRVVERSWDDDALAADWEQLAPGVVETGLRDTVLVWPGQRVRLAVRFADHLGYFLYHCHVLEHEDAGMMRSYRVVATPS